MKYKSPRERKIDELIKDLPYFRAIRAIEEEGRYFKRTIGYLNNDCYINLG